MGTQQRILVLGVGAFTHSMVQILRDNNAWAGSYLYRNYAHYGPASAGPSFYPSDCPDPSDLVKREQIDFVIPMSIDWAEKPWHARLLESGVPLLCPVGEGLLLERDRDYARRLCADAGIPFPRSHVAENSDDARRFVAANPGAYVIKNPLCSPTSPIHTIVCKTESETLGWLDRLDYREGAFLQEYMGQAEVGHIALVSGGEVYSLVTNQEYKRAFAGNMGIVAGAPLGGLVEIDRDDKYGLAQSLLHPLLPWFRQVDYHGPVQVTAILRNETWHVLEYNVRLGVTSGPLILRMLERPVEVLHAVTQNRKPDIRFKRGNKFGCSVTLAGYGYPYVQVTGPELPLQVSEPFTCDVWWNEVRGDNAGQILASGHRIADVCAVDKTLKGALATAYENIRKIQCPASYYRPDIGQSLWPPGEI